MSLRFSAQGNLRGIQGDQVTQWPAQPRKVCTDLRVVLGTAALKLCSWRQSAVAILLGSIRVRGERAAECVLSAWDGNKSKYYAR